MFCLEESESEQPASGFSIANHPGKMFVVGPCHLFGDGETL
jgi:hypothetical protein